MGFAKLGPPLTRNAGPTQRVVEARTRQEGGKHVFRHDDADLRVVDPARARQRRAGGVTKEVAHTCSACAGSRRRPRSHRWRILPNPGD